jgi:Rrf2 family protein
MAELAKARPRQTISVREIAERQGVSVKYLEQIMATLKAAGLARSVRGVRGGYELARPPGSILLSDVFAALEGSTAPVECVEHPEVCSMQHACPTRKTWLKLAEAINGVLSTTKVADLV